MRLILLILAIASCSSTDVISARQLPAGEKAPAAAVARANNAFACDLYAQLATTDGNIVLSPFSITTALAMIDAGAAGITDEELRAALHISLPGDRMHAAYRALLASLAAGRDHDAYTLATANRLFGQAGTPFLERFLQITKRDYGAELMPVDFVNAPEAARAQVNAWVADNTDDKIPELFEPGAFGDATRLVVANAIVFKGIWKNQFKPDRTADAPFRLANGGTAQGRMMHKRDVIAMATIPGGRIGVLPFHGELSMVVALPDRSDGLPAIETQLSGDAITQWIDSATSTAGTDVALPRFGITSTFELPDALAKLGIVSAFNSNADFSALDGGHDLYLQRVLHKATISVDEVGAEAAAATAGVIDVKSAPSFVVDRPFLFWIYDHVTGAILFMGRLQDPTVTGS